MEVLSKDEQLQQTLTNVWGQKYLEPAYPHKIPDNDPRVVALVIRQWINNDRE